jgi:hypothetical protein
MGRWAQYRRRGRGAGGSDAPSFPLLWPTEEEWELSSGGGSVSMTMLVPCPGDAEEVGSNYLVEPSTTFLDSGQQLCFDSGLVVAEQLPGAIVDVRIRWQTAGHVALSDWSATKTIVVLL